MGLLGSECISFSLTRAFLSKWNTWRQTHGAEEVRGLGTILAGRHRRLRWQEMLSQAQWCQEKEEKMSSFTGIYWT